MTRLLESGWGSVWLATAGAIGPLLLGWAGLVYGVFVENRSSGEGPHFSVFVALVALPLLQLLALSAGIQARRTLPGKAGVLLSLAVLVSHVGYFLRWWF